MNSLKRTNKMYLISTFSASQYKAKETGDCRCCCKHDNGFNSLKDKKKRKITSYSAYAQACHEDFDEETEDSNCRNFKPQKTFCQSSNKANCVHISICPPMETQRQYSKSQGCQCKTDSSNKCEAIFDAACDLLEKSLENKFLSQIQRNLYSVPCPQSGHGIQHCQQYDSRSYRSQMLKCSEKSSGSHNDLRDAREKIRKFFFDRLCNKKIDSMCNNDLTSPNLSNDSSEITVSYNEKDEPILRTNVNSNKFGNFYKKVNLSKNKVNDKEYCQRICRSNSRSENNKPFWCSKRYRTYTSKSNIGQGKTLTRNKTTEINSFSSGYPMQTSTKFMTDETNINRTKATRPSNTQCTKEMLQMLQNVGSVTNSEQCSKISKLVETLPIEEESLKTDLNCSTVNPLVIIKSGDELPPTSSKQLKPNFNEPVNNQEKITKTSPEVCTLKKHYYNEKHKSDQFPNDALKSESHVYKFVDTSNEIDDKDIKEMHENELDPLLETCLKQDTKHVIKSSEHTQCSVGNQSSPSRGYPISEKALSSDISRNDEDMAQESNTKEHITSSSSYIIHKRSDETDTIASSHLQTCDTLGIIEQEEGNNEIRSIGYLDTSSGIKAVQGIDLQSCYKCKTNKDISAVHLPSTLFCGKSKDEDVNTFSEQLVLPDEILNHENDKILSMELESSPTLLTSSESLTKQKSQSEVDQILYNDEGMRFDFQSAIFKTVFGESTLNTRTSSKDPNDVIQALSFVNPSQSFLMYLNEQADPMYLPFVSVNNRHENKFLGCSSRKYRLITSISKNKTTSCCFDTCSGVRYSSDEMIMVDQHEVCVDNNQMDICNNGNISSETNVSYEKEGSLYCDPITEKLKVDVEDDSTTDEDDYELYLEYRNRYLGDFKETLHNPRTKFSSQYDKENGIGCVVPNIEIDYGIFDQHNKKATHTHNCFTEYWNEDSDGYLTKMSDSDDRHCVDQETCPVALDCDGDSTVAEKMIITYDSACADDTIHRNLKENRQEANYYKSFLDKYEQDQSVLSSEVEENYAAEISKPCNRCSDISCCGRKRHPPSLSPFSSISNSSYCSRKKPYTKDKTPSIPSTSEQGKKKYKVIVYRESLSSCKNNPLRKGIDRIHKKQSTAGCGASTQQSMHPKTCYLHSTELVKDNSNDKTPGALVRHRSSESCEYDRSFIDVAKKLEGNITEGEDCKEQHSIPSENQQLKHDSISSKICKPSKCDSSIPFEDYMLLNSDHSISSMSGKSENMETQTSISIPNGISSQCNDQQQFTKNHIPLKYTPTPKNECIEFNDRYLCNERSAEDICSNLESDIIDNWEKSASKSDDEICTPSDTLLNTESKIGKGGREDNPCTSSSILQIKLQQTPNMSYIPTKYRKGSKYASHTPSLEGNHAGALRCESKICKGIKEKYSSKVSYIPKQHKSELSCVPIKLRNKCQPKTGKLFPYCHQSEVFEPDKCHRTEENNSLTKSSIQLTKQPESFITSIPIKYRAAPKRETEMLCNPKSFVESSIPCTKLQAPENKNKAVSKREPEILFDRKSYMETSNPCKKRQASEIICIPIQLKEDGRVETELFCGRKSYIESSISCIKQQRPEATYFPMKNRAAQKIFCKTFSNPKSFMESIIPCEKPQTANEKCVPIKYRTDNMVNNKGNSKKSIISSFGADKDGKITRDGRKCYINKPDYSCDIGSPKSFHDFKWSYASEKEYNGLQEQCNEDTICTNSTYSTCCLEKPGDQQLPCFSCARPAARINKSVNDRSEDGLVYNGYVNDIKRKFEIGDHPHNDQSKHVYRDIHDHIDKKESKLNCDAQEVNKHTKDIKLKPGNSYEGQNNPFKCCLYEDEQYSSTESGIVPEVSELKKGKDVEKQFVYKTSNDLINNITLNEEHGNGYLDSNITNADDLGEDNNWFTGPCIQSEYEDNIDVIDSKENDYKLGIDGCNDNSIQKMDSSVYAENIDTEDQKSSDCILSTHSRQEFDETSPILGEKFNQNEEIPEHRIDGEKELICLSPTSSSHSGPEKCKERITPPCYSEHSYTCRPRYCTESENTKCTEEIDVTTEDKPCEERDDLIIEDLECYDNDSTCDHSSSDSAKTFSLYSDCFPQKHPRNDCSEYKSPICFDSRKYQGHSCVTSKGEDNYKRYYNSHVNKVIKERKYSCVPKRTKDDCLKYKDYVPCTNEKSGEVYCCAPKPNRSHRRNRETICYNREGDIDSRFNTKCYERKSKRGSVCVKQRPREIASCDNRIKFAKGSCSEFQGAKCSPTNGRKRICRNYDTGCLIPCVDVDGKVLYYVCASNDRKDNCTRSRFPKSNCSESQVQQKCPSNCKVSCSKQQAKKDACTSYEPKTTYCIDTRINPSECHDKFTDAECNTTSCKANQTDPCSCMSTTICFPQSFHREYDCINKKFLWNNFQCLRQSFLDMEYAIFRKCFGSLISERCLLLGGTECTTSNCSDSNCPSTNDFNDFDDSGSGLDSDCSRSCNKICNHNIRRNMNKYNHRKKDTDLNNPATLCCTEKYARKRGQGNSAINCHRDTVGTSRSSSFIKLGLSNDNNHKQKHLKLKLPSASNKIPKISIMSLVKSFVTVRFRSLSGKMTVARVPVH